MFNFIKALFGFGSKQEAPKVECITDWECINSTCYQNPFDGIATPLPTLDLTLTRTELVDLIDLDPISFITDKGWGLDPHLVDHGVVHPSIDQMTQGELIDLAGSDAVRFVDMLIDFGWV
jgi:hypothetical protein